MSTKEHIKQRGLRHMEAVYSPEFLICEGHEYAANQVARAPVSKYDLTRRHDRVDPVRRKAWSPFIAKAI